jgi:hypothetical protein
LVQAGSTTPICCCCCCWWWASEYSARHAAPSKAVQPDTTPFTGPVTT